MLKFIATNNILPYLVAVALAYFGYKYVTGLQDRNQLLESQIAIANEQTKANQDIMNKYMEYNEIRVDKLNEFAKHKLIGKMYEMDL